MHLILSFCKIINGALVERDADRKHDKYDGLTSSRILYQCANAGKTRWASGSNPRFRTQAERFRAIFQRKTIESQFKEKGGKIVQTSQTCLTWHGHTKASSHTTYCNLRRHFRGWLHKQCQLEPRENQRNGGENRGPLCEGLQMALWPQIESGGLGVG